MCCKECDSLLWSDVSKKLGVCPECNEGEDFLQSILDKDLEDSLESLLNKE